LGVWILKNPFSLQKSIIKLPRLKINIELFYISFYNNTILAEGRICLEYRNLEYICF